jgi:hypothetical protein
MIAQSIEVLYRSIGPALAPPPSPGRNPTISIEIHVKVQQWSVGGRAGTDIVEWSVIVE